MSDERFSPEQAQYLASLPAVKYYVVHVSDMQSGSSVNAFRVLKMVNLPDSEVTSSRTNEGNPGTGGNDMRDLIIRRQALYIRRLGLKVDDLKMQLSQQSLSNDVQ